MGLSIVVGCLSHVEDEESRDYFYETMAVINRYLSESGHSMHEEPHEPIEPDSRADIESFPYSFLHYLRRVYANVKQDPQWELTPVPEREDPAHDEAVESESYMFDSHLLCHSDCEGYYLPIDFTELITGDDVLGGFAGSSYRLMEELKIAALPLGIPFDEQGRLTDQDAAKINEVARQEGDFSREYMTWIAMYEAARRSIQHQCAIQFC